MKKNKTLANLIFHTVYWTIVSSIIFVICHLFFDIPIANYFHDHSNTFTTALGKIIAKAFDPNVWIVVMIIVASYSGYLVFIKKSFSPRAQKWLTISLSLIIAIGITGVLKIVLGRYRPVALFNSGLYGFTFEGTFRKANSTPSGHVALAFAGFMAIASCLEKRKWLYFAVVISILIAISRIITSKHYLGDVILGAYVGLLSFYWGKYIARKFVTYKQVR